MSVHHCDYCRLLHSQCKCRGIGPLRRPAYNHDENMLSRKGSYRKNGDPRRGEHLREEKP